MWGQAIKCWKRSERAGAELCGKLWLSQACCFGQDIHSSPQLARFRICISYSSKKPELRLRRFGGLQPCLPALNLKATSVPGTVKSVPASRLSGLTSPFIGDTVSQSSQSEPSVSLLGHATVFSETPLLTRPPYLSYSITLDVSAGVSLVVVVVVIVVLCCSLLKSPPIVLCLTESSLPPFGVALSGASVFFCSPPLSPAFGTGSDTEQTLYEDALF